MRNHQESVCCLHIISAFLTQDFLCTLLGNILHTHPLGAMSPSCCCPRNVRDLLGESLQPKAVEASLFTLHSIKLWRDKLTVMLLHLQCQRCAW